MSSPKTTEMFELIDVPEDDVVAVRVGSGTKRGYDELYSLLAEKTAAHGSVHVYEEIPGWTGRTFGSHVIGIGPDLRYGHRFRIDRYAAVGDSLWARGLYELWRLLRPVWPVAPEKKRYYDMTDRHAALRWVRQGEEP